MRQPHYPAPGLISISGVLTWLISSAQNGMCMHICIILLSACYYVPHGNQEAIDRFVAFNILSRLLSKDWKAFRYASCKSMPSYVVVHKSKGWTPQPLLSQPKLVGIEVIQALVNRHYLCRCFSLLMHSTFLNCSAILSFFYIII